MLSNSVYNKVKNLAQVGIPAVGALYFGLSQIWGFPAGEEVVGTLTLVDVFLGVVLSYSTKAYNDSDARFDGEIVVEQDPTTGNTIYALELDKEPDDIRTTDLVTFKVVDRGVA